MDFESDEVESEDAQRGTEANSEDNVDSAVAGKIDEFIQLKKPVSDEGINSDSFKVIPFNCIAYPFCASIFCVISARTSARALGS